MKLNFVMASENFQKFGVGIDDLPDALGASVQAGAATGRGASLGTACESGDGGVIGLLESVAFDVLPERADNPSPRLLTDS